MKILLFKIILLLSAALIISAALTVNMVCEDYINKLQPLNYTLSLLAIGVMSIIALALLYVAVFVKISPEDLEEFNS